MQLEEKTNTISVPKEAGVPGLIETVRTILRLSRVMNVEINHRGVVTYRRFVPVGEPGGAPVIDFAGLSPNGVIRNSVVKELPYERPGCHAPDLIFSMFDAVRDDGYFPICFVTGADTTLWRWYAHSAGLEAPERDVFYGYPLFFDRMIPDDVLILCAGYDRNATIGDTLASFKLALVIP